MVKNHIGFFIFTLILFLVVPTPLNFAVCLPFVLIAKRWEVQERRAEDMAEKRKNNKK